jgi:phosphoglycerate dehydrogenase-like enzyme
LGVIGFGASARALIPLAQAFGMAVLCTTSVAETTRSAASGVEFVDLDTLLSRSDYVSIHTALTPQTRHLIDAKALSLMKPAAVLVNTARGQIVDEQALATAVTAGTITGAALDVTEVEPLPAESPLRGVAGITVFSHMAGQTAEARDAAGREGAIELVDALLGRPKFAVNGDTVAAPRVASR